MTNINILTRQSKKILIIFDMNKNNYCVYVHANNINGKRYVGITNNPKSRWYGKGKAYKDCTHFATAIKKYGWDNFTHYLLETDLTLDEANELEQVYIARYKTQDRQHGYNIQAGGFFVPSMLGKHHTEETKRKMREKALGRKISDEQRRHHSEVMKGRLVGAKNHKSTAVICLNTGEVFETQRQAAEAKGVLQSKISLCCQGKREHTHGYRWSYLDKEI